MLQVYILKAHFSFLKNATIDTTFFDFRGSKNPELSLQLGNFKFSISYTRLLRSDYPFSVFTQTFEQVGVSEKTFRKWSLIFIEILANMPVVIKRKYLYIIILRSYTCSFLANFSLIGKIVSVLRQEKLTHSFLLTARISK